MKKYFNWQLPLFVLTVFIIISCSKDEQSQERIENSKITKRSSDCSRSISFTKKLTRYVSFDEPDSELSIGEKSMRLPKIDFQTYRFCEGSDGVIKTTVSQNPNLIGSSDYKSTILGAPRKISWRSETVGDQMSIYSAENEVLSNSTIDNYVTDFDDVLLTYESTLVPSEDYEYFIESMRRNLNVEDINDDIFVVSTETNTGITMTYFDKRCQKEVAVENYDDSGRLINRNSLLYAVDGNSVLFKANTKLSFKNSPDSEKTMSIISVSLNSTNKCNSSAVCLEKGTAFLLLA